jgi:hypothetical protein
MADYEIEETTTYAQLEAKLKAAFSSNLSELQDLETLKKAFRIINGVEDLQTPDNLSASQKETILKNARGTSDAMARAIQAYISNKLEGVRDDLAAATDGEVVLEAIDIEPLTIVMAD